MREVMKGVLYTVTGFGLLVLSSSFAMASEAAQTGSVDYTKAIIIGACAIAAALAISIVGLGVGLAMGGATGSAAQSISRNPDASGKIMLAMIVGMAMTESIAIYALVISLLILYANPMLKYVFA